MSLARQLDGIRKMEPNLILSGHLPAAGSTPDRADAVVARPAFRPPSRSSDRTRRHS